MVKSFSGKTPRIAGSAFISKTAYIIGDVEIGENCVVMPGAVIRADLGKITIGDNTIVKIIVLYTQGRLMGLRIL